MSVDKRIVQMQFNNAQFEAGVAQSMSTLDKLEEKLNFKNSAKGMSNLQTAVDNVTFDKMAKGIESLEHRFSAMGIAGMNVVSKLTDSVLNAAKKLEQMTIGQISSGGWSRAMNLANAQFTIEGLNLDWEEILKAVNYGVQDTAYGLDAAAKAASSLAASGVEYKESVEGANDSLMHTSLRAISGVAAMTNSDYESISRIFTTVAGQGKLMGDQLLQLASRGLNVAATLGDALGMAEVDVRDAVSKGLIDFETFATAMDDAFGAHAKEANKTFTGALSNMKAALSRIGAIFATPVVEKTNVLFNALTSRINDVKNALSDLKNEDGVVVQTRFATHFAEAWEAGISAAEKLTKTFDLSWFDKIATAADNAAIKMRDFFEFLKGEIPDLEEVSDAVAETAEEIAYTEEEIQAALDIWYKKKYGSGDARIANLTAAGLDAKKVQSYIDKFIITGKFLEEEAEDVEESMDDAADSVANFVDNAKKAAKAKQISTFADVLDTIKNVGQIIANVFTNVKTIFNAVGSAFSEVFSFSEAASESKDFTKRLVDLSEALLITEEGAKKIQGVFVKVFSIVKKGINSVSSITKSIIEFVTELINGKKAVEETEEVVSKNVSVLDRLQSLIIKIGDGIKNFASNFTEFVTLVKQTSGVQRLVEAFSNLKNAVSGSVEDGLNNVGDALSSIENNLSAPTIEDVANAIGWVADKIAIFVEKLPQWGTNIENFFGKFKDVISAGFNKLNIDPKVVKEKIVEAFTSDESIIDKIGNFFKLLLGGIKTMLDKIDWGKLKDVGVISLTIASLWNLQSTFGNVSKLVVSIKKIPDMISKIVGSVNNIFVTLSKSLTIVSIGYIISQISKAFLAMAAAIYIISGIPEDQLRRAANTVTSLGLVIALIILAIGTLSKRNTGNVNSLIANLSPGLMFNISVLLVSIGAALKLIVSAMDTMAEMDLSSIQVTATVVGIFMALLLGFVFALMNTTSKVGDFADVARTETLVTLLGVATIVAAIGLAIKMIASSMAAINGNVNAGTFWATVGIMGVLLGGIALILSQTSKIEPGQVWAVAGILAAVGLALTSILVKMAAIALIGTDKIAVSLFVVISVLSSIALVMQQLTNVMKTTESPIWIIAAILSLAVVIEGISHAFIDIFKALDSMSGDNFAAKVGAGIGAIIGSLILMTAAIAVIASMLKKNKNLDSKDLLIIGATFIEVAAALLVVAAAFKVLGSSDNMVASGIVLGVFLGIIVALVAVAAAVPGVTQAITAVGDSFLKIGGAAALAGVGFLAVSAGISIIAKALPKLAVGLTALFKVINEHIVLFTVVTVAIAAITALVVYGVAKIAPILTGLLNVFSTVLKTIGGLLTAGAKNLSTWFNGLSAKTKTAIVALIIGICAALYEASPTMIDTMVNVIIIILDRLADLIDGVVQALLNLIIKLIYALSNAVMANKHRIYAAIMSLISAFWSMILAALSHMFGAIGDWIQEEFAWDGLSNFFKNAGNSLDDWSEEIEANTYELQKNADEMDEYTTKAKELGTAADSTKESTVGLANVLGIVGGAFKEATISAEEYHSALDELGSRHQGMGISSNMEGAYWNELVKAHPELLAELHEIENEIAASGSSAGSSYFDNLLGGMSSSAGGFDMASFAGLNIDESSEGWDFGAAYGDDIVNGYNDTTSTGLEQSTQSSINRAIGVFEDNQGRMETAASDLGGSGVKGSDSRIKDFFTSGQNMANGLANGVKMRTYMLTEVVKELGINMINAFNTTLDEHSPSKVFEQSGIYAVEGVVKGVTAKKDEATTAISDVGDAMIVSFGAPLEHLAKMATGEIQYDTSIRPVLDASNIRAGASGINSMFSNQNVALSTVSGKITSDIGQLDSRNMDVVNELRSLRSDMAEMTATISNMQMVMDTGALVGQISGPINRDLGKKAIYKKRGN